MLANSPALRVSRRCRGIHKKTVEQIAVVSTTVGAHRLRQPDSRGYQTTVPLNGVAGGVAGDVAGDGRPGWGAAQSLVSGASNPFTTL